MTDSLPSNCSYFNGAAGIGITVGFDGYMTQPLTFNMYDYYQGTFCGNPGISETYLTAQGQLSGLAVTGDLTVAATINSTMICITTASVSNITIGYSSLKMTVSVPPLGLNQDVSQKVRAVGSLPHSLVMCSVARR